VSEGIEKLVGNQSDSLEVLAVLPEKEFGEAWLMAEEWGEVAPLIVEKNVDRVLPDNEEETRSERAITAATASLGPRRRRGYGRLRYAP
jgi:hypothetical protein